MDTINHIKPAGVTAPPMDSNEFMKESKVSDFARSFKFNGDMSDGSGELFKETPSPPPVFNINSYENKPDDVPFSNRSIGEEARSSSHQSFSELKKFQELFFKFERQPHQTIGREVPDFGDDVSTDVNSMMSCSSSSISSNDDAMIANAEKVKKTLEKRIADAERSESRRKYSSPVTKSLNNVTEEPLQKIPPFPNFFKSDEFLNMISSVEKCMVMLHNSDSSENNNSFYTSNTKLCGVEIPQRYRQSSCPASEISNISSDNYYTTHNDPTMPLQQELDLLSTSDESLNVLINGTKKSEPPKRVNEHPELMYQKNTTARDTVTKTSDDVPGENMLGKMHNLFMRDSGIEDPTLLFYKNFPAKVTKTRDDVPQERVVGKTHNNIVEDSNGKANGQERLFSDLLKNMQKLDAEVDELDLQFNSVPNFFDTMRGHDKGFDTAVLESYIDEEAARLRGDNGPITTEQISEVPSISTTTSSDIKPETLNRILKNLEGHKFPPKKEETTPKDAVKKEEQNLTHTEERYVQKKQGHTPVNNNCDQGEPSQTRTKSICVQRKLSQTLTESSVLSEDSYQNHKEEKSVPKEQISTQTRSKTSRVQREPSQTRTKSSRVHREPSQTRTKSSRVQREPSQTRTKSSRVQREPSQTRTKSSRVRREPSQTSTKSSRVQREPSQTSTRSSRVQKEPSQTSTKSSHVQKEPSQTRTESDCVEAKPSETLTVSSVGSKDSARKHRKHKSVQKKEQTKEPKCAQKKESRAHKEKKSVPKERSQADKKLDCDPKKSSKVLTEHKDTTTEKEPSKTKREHKSVPKEARTKTPKAVKSAEKVKVRSHKKHKVALKKSSYILLENDEILRETSSYASEQLETASKNSSQATRPKSVQKKRTQAAEFKTHMTQSTQTEAVPEIVVPQQNTQTIQHVALRQDAGMQTSQFNIPDPVKGKTFAEAQTSCKPPQPVTLKKGISAGVGGLILTTGRCENGSDSTFNGLDLQKDHLNVVYYNTDEPRRGGRRARYVHSTIPVAVHTYGYGEMFANIWRSFKSVVTTCETLIFPDCTMQEYSIAARKVAAMSKGSGLRQYLNPLSQSIVQMVKSNYQHRFAGDVIGRHVSYAELSRHVRGTSRRRSEEEMDFRRRCTEDPMLRNVAKYYDRDMFRMLTRVGIIMVTVSVLQNVIRGTTRLR